MNITSGGSHILLFERDQQLAVLLTSELQLAGFDCHTARTAVEVFDAIARYPVRLVLVNLAQAAAARREFWVALDTQRRGRGVQVLTFHCTNIAHYGPAIEDPDERSHTMLADIEVDGMLGIMNMVNAIRSHVAVSNSGAISRSPSPNNEARPQQDSPSASEKTSIAQITAPSPSIMVNSAATTSTISPSASRSPTPMSPPATTEIQKTPPLNQTDIIRAVIYPGQRSSNPSRERDNQAGISGSGYMPPAREPQPTQSTQDTSWSQVNLRSSHHPGMSSSFAPVSANGSSWPPLDAAVESQGKEARNESEENVRWQQSGQPSPPEQKESGLAQLSRMVQEHHTPNQISTLPLRASPIQDLPSERIPGGQSEPRQLDVSTPANSHQYASTPTLMSIATPPASTPVPISSSPQANNTAFQASESVATEQHPVDASITPQFPVAEPTVAEMPQNEPREEGDKERTLVKQLPVTAREQGPAQTQAVEPNTNTVTNTNNTLFNTMQEQVPRPRGPEKGTAGAADNALLLGIVHSLPPMPSPPPQQQVLQGRATRSLGRVLLEGHLVPQNRLEVAQNVQRMLRGVDMNYQLGEILLMFKLLTPDQLLAASLVSYGLITATQISALGRIRQELHSIGLEYDLENLLILFRILTPEQLREVRASWSG